MRLVARVVARSLKIVVLLMARSIVVDRASGGNDHRPIVR